MAVLPDDLLQPKGDLDLALFTGLTASDVSDALEAYLTDAAGRIAQAGVPAADVDAAARAWAYYRAYTRIGQRLLAMARTATIEGQGTRRHEQEQADGFLAIADRWLAQYESLIPPAAAATPAVPPSAALTNAYRW